MQAGGRPAGAELPEEGKTEVPPSSGINYCLGARAPARVPEAQRPPSRPPAGERTEGAASTGASAGVRAPKVREMKRGLLMTWKRWAEASQDHLACSIASQSGGDIHTNPGAAGARELQLPCGIQGARATFYLLSCNPTHIISMKKAEWCRFTTRKLS
ncbi:uncharacterized protein LOC129012757 isoform X1 [Pongo pygmaeus]|uniref:uncharacterized protein LOC129012757 isoform X1 n=1 Tax=Pongo pygmaeus TaxID=9600 RepID=UPI0023E20F3B|nr:uncharacterized protein LOC129012757 isoform X1 [Pongo pygmaeus]